MVLPESMWAEMPMFRSFARSIVTASLNHGAGDPPRWAGMQDTLIRGLPESAPPAVPPGPPSDNNFASTSLRNARVSSAVGMRRYIYYTDLGFGKGEIGWFWHLCRSAGGGSVAGESH